MSICHCEAGALPDEAIPNFVGDCFGQKQERPRNDGLSFQWRGENLGIHRAGWFQVAFVKMDRVYSGSAE